MMYSLAVLIAACTAFTAAFPTSAGLDTRGADPFLGPVTCPDPKDNSKFQLDKEEAATGAAGFKAWIEAGAGGQIDLSGNFKGVLSQTYEGVTFFACSTKKGRYINGNLVEAVLGSGKHLDSNCGPGRASYEDSNDLAIGRTFNGDKFC